MDDEDKRKLAFKYAWDWFNFHATQRLIAFRFFLILIGIVSVGLSKSVGDGQRGFGALVAFFGGLISIAFWLLDIRNTELVNCGRAALDKLEKGIELTIRKDDADRKFFGESLDWFSRLIFRFRKEKPKPQTNKPWHHTLTTHNFWFRSIQLITSAVLFSVFLILLCFPQFLIKTEANMAIKEQARLVAASLQNRAESLRKLSEDILKQPSLAKKGVDDVILRGQAKALLILIEEMSSECRRRPFAEGPCKEYEDWRDVAVPLFEQVASDRRKAMEVVGTVPANKSKELRDRLETFTNKLRKMVEESY